MQCGVCGGHQFQTRKVLWDGLVRDWQISPEEARYIDRQQGEVCTQCGANLRSIVLANALRSHIGLRGTLLEVACSPMAAQIAILELNEAGMLSPVLRRFAHTFGAYPEVDMHALPYDDNSFDIVVHSDTLEHVPNPIHALGECRRVLKPGGSLCFTIPIIVGRMTRSRDGLPKSYHGSPSVPAEDYVVQTEFGADAWQYVISAGFEQVTIHTLDYPAAIALHARK